VRRRSALLLPAAFSLNLPSRADDAAALVVSSRGNLPLLLTVPHDGDQPVRGVPERQSGAKVRDVGTRALAERTAALLQERLGQRPCLVIARFSRKFLDANRQQAEAMESQEALPAYKTYHEQIAAFVADIRQRFAGGALLIDVHGQSQQPEVIFRGTRNGLTVQRLLDRHGVQALQGERSITGVLAARGNRVQPAPDQPSQREDARFAGGYTVFTYGSHRPEGIDAIQLEFGRALRADDALPEQVADALAVFMAEYGLLAPR
jgi:N-formylglutamate amidohydrolase